MAILSQVHQTLLWTSILGALSAKCNDSGVKPASMNCPTPGKQRSLVFVFSRLRSQHCSHQASPKEKSFVASKDAAFVCYCYRNAAMIHHCHISHGMATLWNCLGQKALKGCKKETWLGLFTANNQCNTGLHISPEEAADLCSPLSHHQLF